MISNICFAVVFLVEALISLYYFDFKFERKVSFKLISLFMLISGLILYSISFIAIPLINLIFFFACNFTISIICYKTKVNSAVFANLILLLLNVTTELLIVFPFAILFNFDLNQCQTDEFVLIIQSIMSKSLYFISIWCILKMSKKESKSLTSKFSILLCFLPLSSIILMYINCIIYSVSNDFKIAISIGNALMLISNIIVFYIHESTIRLNNKYTQLLLDKQREKNTIDYYRLLNEQNENSKVLIHDITKHLNTIKQLSENKDSNITQYISEIIDDFNIMNPVDYCNNHIVNLITHRYYEICKKNNINFTINIKNANLDFMKEYDITALLDNLLENAVEAALTTDNKFIDFSICTRNLNFLIIKVSNSCNTKPKYNNGIIASSKNFSGLHGIGTRSIKKTVDKYNGNLEMNYDETECTFTTVIGINANTAKT